MQEVFVFVCVPFTTDSFFPSVYFHERGKLWKVEKDFLIEVLLDREQIFVSEKKQFKKSSSRRKRKFIYAKMIFSRLT